MLSDEVIWAVRAAVYAHFAETGRAPSATMAGARLGLSAAEAAAAFVELHRRHALFLDEATGAIRMAHPFSAILTDFVVRANGRQYWANCAWDAFGIPAALGTAAVAEMVYADLGAPVRRPVPPEGPDDGTKVHFRLPFARWYDDLVFT
jgi:hypothetical protein